MPDDCIPAASVRLRHVDPAYRHRPKLVMPQAALALNGARLKWYDLAYAETPVPQEIRTLACDYLTTESEAGRLELDGDLGFVVLHRCNNDFFFLIVSTWRGENELWEIRLLQAERRHARLRPLPARGPAQGRLLRLGAGPGLA